VHCSRKPQKVKLSVRANKLRNKSEGSKYMTRKMLCWSLTSFLIAALIAAAGLRGQSDSSVTQNNNQVLQGSFLVTVHVDQTGRTFKTLDTYSPGGGVVVTFFDATGAQINSHGAWSRTPDGEFLVTHEAVSPDVVLPTGPVSFVSAKIRDKQTLDESGNNLTGVFQVQFFDPTGNIVRVASGTINGTRIVAEPLD